MDFENSIFMLISIAGERVQLVGIIPKAEKKESEKRYIILIYTPEPPPRHVDPSTPKTKFLGSVVWVLIPKSIK